MKTSENTYNHTSEPSTGQVLRRPKLLVVDGEEYNRLLYQLELEDEGYQVIPAANSQDAMKVLEREMVDLMVLGVVLHDILMIKDLQQILTMKRDTPCIINSVSKDARGFFMKLGAEGWVEKSSDLKKLKETIRICLSQEAKNQPRTGVQYE